MPVFLCQVTTIYDSQACASLHNDLCITDAPLWIVFQRTKNGAVIIAVSVILGTLGLASTVGNGFFFLVSILAV